MHTHKRAVQQSELVDTYCIRSYTILFALRQGSVYGMTGMHYSLVTSIDLMIDTTTALHTLHASHY
jgi:hypothetical protein